MPYEKFWVDDLGALVGNFQLLPTKSMSLNEKLNTLTRLAIIVAVVMYFMEFELTFTAKDFPGVPQGKELGELISKSNAKKFIDGL